ncbi:unnamed protein product [Dracunculus medinensis]|uniref:DUF5641 domain-containing protein n=1 Tax=Dracunculus medinensis TaxID=318479 RepID=A0A158Q6I0_DRAME|nr:unnamed protein product [Dracunculus medinensis]
MLCRYCHQGYNIALCAKKFKSTHRSSNRGPSVQLLLPSKGAEVFNANNPSKVTKLITKSQQTLAVLRLSNEIIIDPVDILILKKSSLIIRANTKPKLTSQIKYIYKNGNEAKFNTKKALVSRIPLNLLKPWTHMISLSRMYRKALCKLRSTWNRLSKESQRIQKLIDINEESTPFKRSIRPNNQGSIIGHALNQLYKGPSFILQLIAVLLRLRKGEFLLMGWPQRQSKRCHKIPLAKKMPINSHLMIIFSSSIDLLEFPAVIKFHLEIIDTDLSRQVINNLYIDNVFLTFDDQQKIIQSYEQFRIFSKVMMNVHKFISNSEKIEFQALNPGKNLSEEHLKTLIVEIENLVNLHPLIEIWKSDYNNSLKEIKWPVAKILAVHDSSDNNTIRYAAIQLANGKQLSRPISLLYHLEIDEKQC